MMIKLAGKTGKQVHQLVGSPTHLSTDDFESRAGVHSGIEDSRTALREVNVPAAA